jgi:hypothetical protein
MLQTHLKSIETTNAAKDAALRERSQQVCYSTKLFTCFRPKMH